MGRRAWCAFALVWALVATRAARAEQTTEEQFAASVVVPRCEAEWGVAFEKDVIAQEKANPSGVVDLAALHEAGQILQAYQASIKKLDPAYMARRHHSYRGWVTEPACIVEYEKEMLARGCTRVEDPGGKSHHWVCP